MKNEEKAKEIANKYVALGFDCTFTSERYEAAMEMAEWKEQQFKTKIEELFNQLEKEGYNDRVKSGFEIFKNKII